MSNLNLQYENKHIKSRKMLWNRINEALPSDTEWKLVTVKHGTLHDYDLACLNPANDTWITKNGEVLEQGVVVAWCQLPGIVVG